MFGGWDGKDTEKFFSRSAIFFTSLSNFEFSAISDLGDSEIFSGDIFAKN